MVISSAAVVALHCRRNLIIKRKWIATKKQQPQHYCLHTNAHKSVLRDDPYHRLGLQAWTAPTETELRQAFLARAAVVHPDVNKSANAVRDFQRLMQAYQSLLKRHHYNHHLKSDDENWSTSIWRNSDRIARDRTDVAGVQRKRPIPSAPSVRYVLQNTSTQSAEYLSSGNDTPKKKQSSSVGTGRNKWVDPPTFVPWSENKEKK